MKKSVFSELFGLDCSVLKRQTYDQHGFRSRRKSLDQLCRRSFRSQPYSGSNSVAAEGEKLEVKVCGLMGGHSGSEIDKKRANANVVMGRFPLWSQDRRQITKLFLYEGGQKDNAITREAICEILVAREDVEAVKASAAKAEDGLREEYAGS